MRRFVYRLKEDMTTRQLADKFNTTAYSIQKLNNVGEQLFRGMRIIIQEGEGQLYVVQPFDTLESIAKAKGVDIEKIKQFNDIDGVFIGQKIFLPKS